MHHLYTKYTEMKRTLKACSLILLKCICTSHYNKSTRVPSFAFSNIQMIKDLSEKKTEQKIQFINAKHATKCLEVSSGTNVQGRE